MKWKPGVPQAIHGLSHVRFGPDGRVTDHLDYWDAAGELYAKLPVVGPRMHCLARRMAYGAAFPAARGCTTAGFPEGSRLSVVSVKRQRDVSIPWSA